MREKNKLFFRISVLISSIMISIAITQFSAYANNSSVIIDGRIYNFAEKEQYDYSNKDTFQPSMPKENTYGQFSISGNVDTSRTQDGIISYGINGNEVEFFYTYTDENLHETNENWHLIDDKSKQIDGIQLNSKMNKGILILQTSKDGISWNEDVIISNIFEEMPIQKDAFYKANSVQLANGCYYRLIVAYKTGKIIGQDKFLFINTDKYEYRKTAEVYEFYLYDVKAFNKSENTLSKNLGTLSKTGKDNGYSGNEQIGINDPHYGWELGQFFVSGYTRATEDKGEVVFLKNVGDQITLWFSLKQELNKLNKNENLSITNDKNGYDQYFQTAKTDMGKGALIIRYTDERGIKHEPEIYTNYLEANTKTAANTKVKLFEEGDYEVALDYEIKNTPRKVGGIEVIPEYTNYRIFFKFSVRNGNCMVYPFDILGGNELTHQAITKNGFKLDMAKSKYLTIDVQRSVVYESANGFVEDVRFNRPAKDGDEYKEEGIYKFSVKNLYTGENITKIIYVGDTPYMKALSLNKMTIAELNEQISLGASIEDNGLIITTRSENESKMPTDSRENNQDIDSTKKITLGENFIPVVPISISLLVIFFVLIITRKKKS